MALFVALMLASLLVVFEDSAVSVALPSIQRDLDLGIDALEWTLNAYTVGLVTILLLAGGLVDRMGARRSLVIGLGLFTTASIPAALADDRGVLITARAVQGLGAGFIAPASLAAVAAMFPDARRGLAIGVWSGLGAIGLGAGPLLGGLMVEYFGWRSLFLVNLPLIALLIGVARTPALGAPTDAGRGRLDIGGAAAAGIAFVFVLLAMTRGGPDGWASATVVALWAGALLSGAIFAVIEMRVGDPVVPVDALRSRHLLGALAVGLLSTAGMCSLFFFVSLYLQSVAGYRVVGAGAVFLPMTAVIALGSPLAGLAGRRVSGRLLAATGMTLLAAAMAVLSRIGEGLGVMGITGGLAIAGAGVALTATPVTTIALAALPASRRGLAGALVSTARTVGLALGVAVMGAILGDAEGPLLTVRLASGLQLNAVVASAGAVLAVVLLRPSRP